METIINELELSKCNACGVDLKVGKNWYQSNKIAGVYNCNNCHNQKTNQKSIIRHKNNLPLVIHVKTFDNNSNAIKRGYSGKLVLQEMFLRIQLQFDMLGGPYCIYTLSPLGIGIRQYPTMVLEHIYPVSVGGNNLIHNVVFAENGFNMVKGHTILPAFGAYWVSDYGYTYIKNDASARIDELNQRFYKVLPEYRTRYDKGLIVCQKQYLNTINNPDMKVSNRYPGDKFFDDLWISDELREKFNGKKND